MSEQRVQHKSEKADEIAQRKLGLALDGQPLYPVGSVWEEKTQRNKRWTRQLTVVKVGEHRNSSRVHGGSDITDVHYSIQYDFNEQPYERPTPMMAKTLTDRWRRIS